jgi:hypothetical protein
VDRKIVAQPGKSFVTEEFVAGKKLILLLFGSMPESTAESSCETTVILCSFDHLDDEPPAE